MPMKKPILLLLTLLFVATTQAGVLDGLFSSSDPAEFKSADGGVSVRTPVTLKESITTKNPVVSSDGKTVELTVHQFGGSKDGLAYSVGYNDYPEWVFTLGERPAVVEALLGSAGLGLTKLSNGKPLLETKITLGPYPGREVLVEFQQQGQKAIAKARYYLVGRRLYQIMVLAPSGKGGMSDINAFLGSFQLLKMRIGLFTLCPTSATPNMDFTIPLSITGVAVVGFIFIRRPLCDLLDRTESLAWIGLKAPHRRDNHPSLSESQSAIQPIQLESALASEQRHRDHEAQISAMHNRMRSISALSPSTRIPLSALPKRIRPRT